MAEFQISKIQLRRGAELDLPGKPTKLSPLTFEAGLDTAEFGFTVDTSRLFIGVSPKNGQPNYKRTSFPYQNLEVLTEASTETLQRIFNFLERDVGGGGFYTATLQPTGDGDWQDVKVDRAYGSATAFRLPGEEIIVAFQYHMAEQDDSGTFPLRTGAVRFMSETGVEECWAKDDSLSIRRLDLPTPQAMDSNLVFENVTFRLLRGGGIGDRFFRLQYTSIGDLPVRLWFRIERPLTYTATPFDTGRATSGSLTGGGAYSQMDVRQIVGSMLKDDTQVGIQVTYDDCGGKLNFTVDSAPVAAAYQYSLTFNTDVSGSIGISNTTGPNYTVPLSLAPTGVTPGTYYVPTLTVDRAGRISSIVNGTLPTPRDPDAIYNALNLGTGADLFASVNGRSLQFRSLTAGAGIAISGGPNEVLISSTLTPSTGQNLGTNTNVYMTTDSNGVLKFRTLKAGSGIAISGSATDITITATTPPATGGDSTATYVANGGPQSFAGTAADGLTPPVWSAVASLNIPVVAGQARTITASATIGANLAGFPVARYLRLSVGGTVVYTATQPWGEPWMGGNLTISYLDAAARPTGTVPVLLEAAYVATNSGAPSFTTSYSVYNATLNVLGFVSNAATSSTTLTAFTAPGIANPVSVPGSSYAPTTPTIPTTAKWWRVNISGTQQPGQNPGLTSLHFYDPSGAMIPLDGQGSPIASDGTGLNNGFLPDGESSASFPGWQSSATTGYIGFHFASSVNVAKISMQGYVNQSPAISPSNFTIENSIDGVTWNVTKTYTNADAALYHATIYYAAV